MVYKVEFVCGMQKDNDLEGFYQTTIKFYYGQIDKFVIPSQCNYFAKHIREYKPLRVSTFSSYRREVYELPEPVLIEFYSVYFRNGKIKKKVLCYLYTTDVPVDNKDITVLRGVDNYSYIAGNFIVENVSLKEVIGKHIKEKINIKRRKRAILIGGE